MISSPGCAVGAFVNGMENLASFQTLIGKKLATVLCYVHWLTPFPREEMEKVAANGSIPLITWEPWITDHRMTLPAIAEGAFEHYCVDFLTTATESNHPILLRFAHEMNGDWYPWDGSHNHGEIAGGKNYLQAWKYIYHLAKKNRTG